MVSYLSIFNRKKKELSYDETFQLGIPRYPKSIRRFPNFCFSLDKTNRSKCALNIQNMYTS